MQNAAASILVALVVLVAAPTALAAAPDLQVDRLATGPYSQMHMLLEKTVFAVDVLTVDVRFDPATQRRFRTLAAQRPGTDALVGHIADAAVHADEVFIKLEFKRDVSLNRWVAAVRESLDKAWRAEIIDESNMRHVSENLPVWFRGVAERGFRYGDQILYRGYADRLRTVLVSAQGDVLLDQTDPGTAPRLALLGGYFAPGTEFREPLVRSLLGS
jgi:hypothetical protein